MNPTTLRKLGLVLAGVVMGLLGLAFGAWFYLQAARVDEARSAIGERLQIASDAIEEVEFIEDTAIRAVLRDVVLYDDAGESIVSAPRVALTLDATTLEGDGPIEFYAIDIQEPDARLVQSPDGEWNLFRAMGMSAGGEPVETEEGRPLVFRDITIDNGDLVLAIPVEGGEPEDTRFALNLPRTTLGGVPYQVYEFRNVEAELPTFRVGDDEGWSAVVESLAAQVVEPDIQIDQFAGVFEAEGEDGVTFELAALRFGDSAISGSGLLRFTDEGILYDAELEAEALYFADLRPLLPNLDADGLASFALDIESVRADRLRLGFTDLDVTSTESTVRGSIAIGVGGEIPLALLDADLELDPLRLSTLAELGIVEDLPVLGDVTGRVSTAGAADGFASVDIRADIVPVDDPAMDPSTLFAAGTVALGDVDEPVRLDGLTVSAQPLHLATLRSFAPEQADRLRGDVSGTATLAGTLEDVRISGGDLSYAVGDAPTTTLRGLSGRFVMGEDFRYELSAVADPLAMETLRELFPALPVQPATLSGPIEISGDAQSAFVDANLSGAAGGIQFAGSLGFGDPLRFDIDGSLRAFTAGMILRPEVPVEGPLTGQFSIAGTTEQFAFDVDFQQAEGRFALTGTAGFGTESPRFQVAGDVADFRLGALLGAPQLFPDPLTGAIQLEGGAGSPYVFDVDLSGELGRLDLAGFYEARGVPRYEITGSVAGLDLSGLPTGLQLPPTNLTGTVDFQGKGIQPETLQGSFAFDFTESTVADLPLSTALAEITVQGGVMLVDTLHVQLEQTRLAAEGRWGLTQPAQEPLRYTFVSPDLSVLSRLLAPAELIPPTLEGSLRAEGEVGGSFENPDIVTRLAGQNLRYEDWRTNRIELTADVDRDPALGWAGEVAVVSDDLVIPGVETFQSVRVEASGNESEVALGIFARRDAESDIAMSGLLELEGIFPRGIGLQTMALRVDGIQWNLLDPARLRYTASEGLTVQNLQLQRVGEEAGLISINGTVPPEGIANLSIQATNVDLADLQRISTSAPVLAGVVDIDALLSGPVESPELTLLAEVDDLTYQGVTTEEVTIDVIYAGQRLTGTARGVVQGTQLFSADLDVPMLLSLGDLSPSFELLSTEPLDVTLVADSLPLNLVTAAVPGLAEGSGVAEALIEIGGTLESPSFRGTAQLQNGAFTSEMTAVRYTGISADLALDGSTVLINRFAATSGGNLEGSGRVNFVAGGDPRVSLNATFNDFEVVDNPDLAELTASGQLAVNGPLTAPVVTGQVEISESTFQVPELATDQPRLDLGYTDVAQLTGMPGEGGLAVVPPILGDIRIDGVQVGIDESVWLESDELRVQITGNVVLYRTGPELRIFGSLQAARGTYALEISGITREFDVISGRVQFFGTGDLNPSLDIVAGYRVRGSTVGSGGDLNILVQVSGTLLSPRLALSADTPVPLSEADLISYLLFGQPSFELGGVNQAFAEQLLVQEFVGGFLATELERPLLRAGICDWVRVRPGVTTSVRGLVGGGPLQGAVIECGTELASEIFLTAQTSIGGLFGGDFNDWRLGLEWQIDNEWMWEASYGTVLRDPAFRIFDPTRPRQFSTDLTRTWEYGLPSRRNQIDLTPVDELPGNEASPPIPPTPSLLDSGGLD